MNIWAIILMYLGAGTILGAVIMLASGVFETALGIGGIIALIGVSMYGFCVYQTLRAQRNTEK